MKVLLTGASGFVGSHVLESLCARSTPTAVLLRPSSRRTFLPAQPGLVEVRSGSIDNPQSLQAALEGITHVIHCAGLTKARRPTEFYQVNQVGTQNVVDAVNACGSQVQRLVHISSLAAAGPATPAQPIRETDPPQPVSIYGKSKLAGENAVRSGCKTEFCIVRPPAVYGPRDTGFLSMFQAVHSHILPRSSASQVLSIVFVRDLAEAIVTCLQHPSAAGQTFFAASSERTTGRAMAEEIASQMDHWTLPLPLPTAALWPVCLLQEALSHLTGKAAMLNLQKFAELRAPGWVCDASALERKVGFACKTGLKTGLRETLSWYRQNHWL